MRNMDKKYVHVTVKNLIKRYKSNFEKVLWINFVGETRKPKTIIFF